MDNKTIKEIQQKLETKSVEYERNAAYVNGKNPFILRDVEPKDKPDNRVPVPLAKMTVDDQVGYSGRAGDHVTEMVYNSLEAEIKEDPFFQYVQKSEEYNDEHIETSELYEEVCSQGFAYEILWTSAVEGQKELMLEYKIVPADSVWCEWSDDIKPVLLKFYYFSGDKDKRYCTVYDDKEFRRWVSKDGGDYAPDGEAKSHAFGEPPLNIFKANRNRSPIFEAGKPLIDAYDKVISRGVNEVDRFNDAIPVFAEIVSEEFRRALREGKVTDIGEQADSPRTDLPKYLSKDLTGVGEYHENLLNRLKEDYFNAVLTIDLSDDKFGGNQASGVAMAYKTLKLEFSAAKIDTYFNPGLIKRLEFYAAAYNAGKVSNTADPNDYRFVVKTKRNIPVDTQAMVAVAIQLKAIGLSMKTILSYMPNQIVEDVEAELMRQEKEAQERQNRLQTMENI